MTDLLKQGAAWLAGQLAAHAAQSVTYGRGEDSCVLAATFGRTEFQVADDYDGLRTEHSDRDFLVRACDLMLGGDLALPQRGDWIRCEDGSVYEVMAPGGEQPYRLDPHGVQLRIHTKRVS